jgi:hypothetical protein
MPESWCAPAAQKKTMARCGFDFYLWVFIYVRSTCISPVPHSQLWHRSAQEVCFTHLVGAPKPAAEHPEVMRAAEGGRAPDEKEGKTPAIGISPNRRAVNTQYSRLRLGGT